VTSAVHRVELVAVGVVPPALLRELMAELRRCLPWPVTQAASKVDASAAFDRRRGQYLAPVLIEALLRPSPAPGLRRIGVTDLDLFLPVFTHVFGYAPLQGPVAIASSHRLRPELGGPAHRKQLCGRLVKEILHELGHTLGLIHCSASWCVMSPSRSAEEIDLKDASYCEACAKAIGAVGTTVEVEPCEPP